MPMPCTRRVTLRDNAIAMEAHLRRHDDLIEPAHGVDGEQVVNVADDMLIQIGAAARPAELRAPRLI